MKGISIPYCTLAIAVASIFATILPALSDVLIFDRQALLDGELWRIFTAHMVHFSVPHLTYNLIIFIVCGYIIEKNSRQFCQFYFYLAIAISLSLFFIHPDMFYYGGLSGIVYGLLYYCALIGICNNHQWRLFYLLIIVFLPMEIWFEKYHNAPVLPYWEQQNFIPMHTSHIIGCCVAILFFLSNFIRKYPLNQAGKSKPDKPAII